MKKYILTIAYDEDNEDIEFVSEEIVETAPGSGDLSDIDISEYFDKEILEFMDECYIIGKA